MYNILTCEDYLLFFFLEELAYCVVLFSICGVEGIWQTAKKRSGVKWSWDPQVWVLKKIDDPSRVTKSNTREIL
jgi:hypothetical protein